MRLIPIVQRRPILADNAPLGDQAMLYMRPSSDNFRIPRPMHSSGS